MKIFSLFVLALGWSFFQAAFAQSSAADSTKHLVKNDTLKVITPPKPRPSPMAVACHKEETIYLKVTYCQPFRKGRQVFTELAPFGKVWRTGANEATELTVTKDLKIGGKPLKAGTYTVFTIPNPDKWTIILNSELGQWGEYKYDSTKDVLSVEVPTQKNNEVYEAFTIQFNETKTGADMSLLWDATKVVVPFTFAK
jgi:hypothetical protein